MQMDGARQQWTNKEYIFVAVLLLLGTLIAVGVVHSFNLQKLYSQPAVATKPPTASRPNHGSSGR